jgi:hypothetical protein
MTSVNPNGKGWTYRAANTLFKAPGHVQNWTNTHMATDTGASSKVQNGLVKVVGGLAKEIVDYDYREFPRLALGKFSVPLSGPPKGALLLLLYPGTVIPRLYRAYQRGKENNDYREMGDVLRRDLTAITLFVFAMGPIVKGLSALTQKASGVSLLDPNDQSVLKYSQFKNYDIDQVGVLKAILAEGNGKALVNAVNGLHARGLGASGKGSLAATIDDIKKSVHTLADHFEQHRQSQPGKLDDLAKAAFGHFETAEKLREDALKEAQKGGSADMVKVAQKMQGEFKGVLQNYAKVRRLPGDVVSFAIMVGAIGYLPMWVNTEWNRRQFEKKMAAKTATGSKAAQAPALPAPTFGLNTSVQPQLGFGTQLFGTLPSPVRQNPFNRTI